VFEKRDLSPAPKKGKPIRSNICTTGFILPSIVRILAGLSIFNSHAGKTSGGLLSCGPMNFLGRTWVGEWLAGLGRIAVMTRDAVASCLSFKFSRRDLFYQIYFIGIKSQSVVLVTGAFTGMVLTAQTYFQFHKVKMDTATLGVVAVAMCDELGPVLTALMVAGRVGAAIAAELGTMRVTEQIDALRTLATHPIDYLVVPRLMASMIALPLLTIESIALGIASGYLVGSRLLGIDPVYLYYNMLKYTTTIDVHFGLIKSFVYGGIIALIGCYKGLTCGMGAEGVGRATTEAVVYSSITILITNFFLTLMLQRLYVMIS
jgi:phospholipid/cholesterol/gamma-HCH transport system permease protein